MGLLFKRETLFTNKEVNKVTKERSIKKKNKEKK